MIRLLILWLALWPAAVGAQTVTMRLSQNFVPIDASFAGGEILAFGALIPGAGQTARDLADIDIVVTVAGPPRTVTVRHKTRALGIWVNTGSTTIAQVPSFYATAETAPLRRILNWTDGHLLSVNDRLRASLGPGATREDVSYFAALLRIGREKGFYVDSATPVDVQDDTLFRTRFTLPGDLPPGGYVVTAYLLRGGTVIASQSQLINVDQIGLSLVLRRMAMANGWFYGGMTLILALGAGWAAAAITARGR